MINNIINITNNQIEKIRQWANKNYDLVYKNFYPFLFNGEIRISGIFEKHPIQELSKSIVCVTFEIMDLGNNEYSIKLTLKNTITNVALNYFIYTYKDHKFNYYERQTSDDKILNAISNQYNADKNILIMFLQINAYFFHYKQDVKTLEQKKVKKHTQKVKNRYVYNNIKYLEKSYTITGKIYNNKIPKTHEWHIDSWQVIGHLRHYKNGKCVFIKPYVKGKNKDKLTTVYKINNKEV